MISRDPAVANVLANSFRLLDQQTFTSSTTYSLPLRAKAEMVAVG